jgi:hypothetical protein
MHYSEVMMRFAGRHNLEDFGEKTLKHLYDGDFDLDKADSFKSFYSRIESELLNHDVIIHNGYTRWFKDTNLTDADVRHFIVQFSVFSNQFLIAQLHKMVNAHTIESMRSSKEILANEIGVLFNDRQSKEEQEKQKQLGDISGSIEGGTFHFRSAHFELLARLGERLSLHFDDLGRREHGSPSTLFFCDELIRLYGSSDYATSEAASFAVEHWAAAGFWKELISGLTHYREDKKLDLPLTFFTWHDRLEDNHARHTKEELEEYYFTHEVDEDLFIDKGNEMLDGVYAFWQGLDGDRQRLH